jgi:hypothetical protein
MRIYKTIALIALISSQVFAGSQSITYEGNVLRNLMLGEQKPNLEVANSCLYQAYLKLTNGKFEEVGGSIKSCNTCNSGRDTVSNYYCQKILSAAYMWMGKYDLAYLALNEILIYENRLAELGFDIESFKGFLNYLELAKWTKRNEISLNVNSNGELVFREIMVDTGSIFDTNSKHCKKTNKSSKINYLLNNSETFSICSDDNFPYINYPKEIIGLMNLSLYDRVIIQQRKKIFSKKVKLHFDFDSIFFLAKTEYSETSVNICIDTGSSKSSINFKFYRKHYDKFNGIKTQIIQSENSSTNFKIRGKILSEFTVNTDEFSHTFENIPIFIDRTPWFHCDVIAGRDLINEHFKEINFAKQVIYIE